jgi:serine/threonine-protein kinase
LQGRYRIIERVAAGAMGVVYRGERVTLGRQVAVKFLHPWIATQQAFRTRFETEARAMSRLSHPNCVSVIDFGLEGSPYVVMDFVPGFTLRHILVETGRLLPPRAVVIARQVLAGVAHAHAHGIIHRDLKPENLILGDAAGIADHVRILDFGLAKLRDGPAMTAGLAIGTPGYMSPEQTGAPGEIDGRTDIYAVGILLFEMLAGRKPFVSDKVAEVLLMHRDAPPPSLRQLVPDAKVSSELEKVVNRALAKSAEDRFQTAAEFAQALDQVPESRAARSASDFPAPASGVPDPLPGTAAHRAEMTVADPLPGQSLAPASPPATANASALRTAATGLVSLTVRRWIGLGAMAAIALVLVVIGARRQPPAPVSSGAVSPPRVAGGVTTPARAARGDAPVEAKKPASAGETKVSTVDQRPTRPQPAAPTATTPIAAAPSTTTTAATARATVDERLSRADGLLASGDWEAARAVLEKTHREHPDDATVSYRLANLLLENKRWSEGAQAARAAGQHDRKFRSDERLVKNLIRALGTDKGYEKTEDVLHDFGAGPTPLLKDAAARDPNPLIRRRAAELLRSRDDGRARGNTTRPAARTSSSRPFFSR